MVGVYWNNHHHMLHTVAKVSGGILWANMHLLFWLSPVSFTTGWMGENHFSSVPVAVYAFDLLMCAIAYSALQAQTIKLRETDAILARAVGNHLMGKALVGTYLIAVPLALFDYS